MRYFKLIATASGHGSSLVDMETGLAIDGVKRVVVRVEHGKATEIEVTFLGKLEAELEGDATMRQESGAWDTGGD